MMMACGSEVDVCSGYRGLFLLLAFITGTPCGQTVHKSSIPHIMKSIFLPPHLQFRLLRATSSNSMLIRVPVPLLQISRLPLFDPSLHLLPRLLLAPHLQRQLRPSSSTTARDQCLLSCSTSVELSPVPLLQLSIIGLLFLNIPVPHALFSSSSSSTTPILVVVFHTC